MKTEHNKNTFKVSNECKHRGKMKYSRMLAHVGMEEEGEGGGWWSRGHSEGGWTPTKGKNIS